ncbi:trypsin-like peptidase domain-containing protein [Sorangium sp. So ce269]
MQSSKLVRSRLILTVLPLLGLAACLQTEDPLETESLDSSPQASQCGPTWDAQDVELYDGSLGVSYTWVETREPQVGYLVGTGCSGTLISSDLFLSAGHCDYTVGDEIRFNYQNAPDGTARPTKTIKVSQVLEQEDSNDWDYAIVKLETSAGLSYRPIAAVDPEPGSLVIIIGHPAGAPKAVHAAPMPNYTALNGNKFPHQVDTVGGSSGAGVLSPYGFLIGVHTTGGCSLTGANYAMRMSRLIEHSPTLQALVF